MHPEAPEPVSTSRQHLSARWPCLPTYHKELIPVGSLRGGRYPVGPSRNRERTPSSETNMTAAGLEPALHGCEWYEPSALKDRDGNWLPYIQLREYMEDNVTRRPGGIHCGSCTWLTCVLHYPLFFFPYRLVHPEAPEPVSTRQHLSARWPCLPTCHKELIPVGSLRGGRYPVGPSGNRERTPSSETNEAGAHTCDNRYSRA